MTITTHHDQELRIDPIDPTTLDITPTVSACLSRQAASRRTFGLRGPSRRTFGYRGPSRRTFGFRGPSRRTFGWRGPSVRTGI